MRKLSLANEILGLSRVIQLGRLALDLVDQRGLPTVEDEVEATGRVSSLLTLVISRLDQLRRVARGSDPRDLLTAHNAVKGFEAGEIVRSPHSIRTTIARMRAEVERLEGRQKIEQRIERKGGKSRGK